MSYLQFLNIDDELNKKMLKTIKDIREKQIDEMLEHDVPDKEISIIKKYTNEKIPISVPYNYLHGKLDNLTMSRPLTSHYLTFTVMTSQSRYDNLLKRKKMIDTYFNNNNVDTPPFVDPNSYKNQINTITNKIKELQKEKNDLIAAKTLFGN